MDVIARAASRELRLEGQRNTQHARTQGVRNEGPWGGKAGGASDGDGFRATYGSRADSSVNSAGNKLLTMRFRVSRRWTAAIGRAATVNKTLDAAATAIIKV